MSGSRTDAAALSVLHRHPGLAAGFSALSGLVKGGIDLLLPHRCPITGDLLYGHAGLSPAAWKELTFLAGPCCERCGLPFDTCFPEPVLCGVCMRDPPSWDKARSTLAYDDHSRTLLLAFKHGDRLDLAPLLGRLLMQSAGELAQEADLVAAVPMHRMRLLSRQYNQAAVLARRVGLATGLPVIPDLLRRTRATESQGRKSALARARNVRGAFDLRENYCDTIRGSRILLIDDVLTTGSTVRECAKTLKKHGAGAVVVATLARALRAAG